MSFSPSQLAVISSMKAPLKAAPMIAEITAGDLGVSGSGHKQAIVTLTPIENGTKQSSLTLKDYIQQVDDAIATNPKALARVKRKAHGFFKAVDPAFPDYPEKVGRNEFKTKDGATLNYDQYYAFCKQVSAAIFAALEKLTPEQLKGYVGKKVFMCPQVATMDKANRVSQFVNWVAADLRDGEEPLTTGLVDTDLQATFIETATAETVEAAA